MSTIYRDSNIIGIVIGCKRKYDSRKVNTISLDGTPYVQTPGKPIDRREMAVFCESLELRNALDEASNDGALLIIDDWMNQEIRGYIEKDVTWREKRDTSGVGKFTLVVKEVIDL